MYIEWENFNKEGFTIDYYGITLKGGKVIKNRIYYTFDGSTVTSINPFFDKLTQCHLLKCFSMGEGNNYVKYDFRVNDDCRNKTLEYIADYIDFCPKMLIDDIRHIFCEHGKSFYFRVFGTTVEQRLKNIISACFYFYTHEKIDVVKDNSFINDLLNLFLHNCDNNEKVCWPMCNEEGYLCLIALDFSSAVCKIKFYFELFHGYDRNQFLKVFEGSKAYNIVLEIVSANARIDAFQTAITEDGQISYNFYLREK